MCTKYEREHYSIVHATTMNRHKWANYDIIGNIREYTRDGGILVESNLTKAKTARQRRNDVEEVHALYVRNSEL